MRQSNYQYRQRKTVIFLSVLLLFSAYSCKNNSISPGDAYLGQTPPGDTPELFPLSVRKGFFAAERIAISSHGKDIYYSEIEGYYPVMGENIRRYTFEDGRWTGPFDIFPGYAPALSVTGDTMFLERDKENKFQTYISVRNGKNWGEPKPILSRLDSVHYLHSTSSGNYYISTLLKNGTGLSDWCRLEINGNDTAAISLGRPINTSGDNLDFFISPDESYMIVTNRPALAVSFRKADGNWTNPRNFGEKINFGLGAWGPWVTADKKYLFYSTGTKPDYSDVAVYWVRIDSLIDSLKNTNQSPYIRFLLDNQSASAGKPFTYTVPDNLFIDEDSQDSLIYSAQMPDGKPLPAWLSFDPGTRSFSGTPSEAGELTVKVVVTDRKMATAYCPFKINISKNKQ